MRRDHMNRLLREELQRLPRGAYTQNEFRMVYAIERRHALGLDTTADPRASFARAVASVRERHPDFDPVITPAGSRHSVEE